LPKHFAMDTNRGRDSKTPCNLVFGIRSWRIYSYVVSGGRFWDQDLNEKKPFEQMLIKCNEVP
jgi:hypothetical protein